MNSCHRFFGLRRGRCQSRSPARLWLLLPAILTVSGSPLLAQQPRPAAEASQVVTRQINQLAQEQQTSTALDRQLQSLRLQQQQLSLQLDNQKIYNAHLERLLHSQQQQMLDTRRQLQSIADTDKQLVPLMYRMIADL